MECKAVVVFKELVDTVCSDTSTNPAKEAAGASNRDANCGSAGWADRRGEVLCVVSHEGPYNRSL